MIDERIARLRAHQRNIERYQGLLRTRLSELEFQFLHKRLREEQLAMLRLTPPPVARNRFLAWTKPFFAPIDVVRKQSPGRFEP